MLASVSGAGGILVQGIAWIDMSQKAGGIRYLTEVIVDAPPCELCESAQRMLNQSDDRQQAPLSDWVKVSKMSMYPASVFNCPKEVLVVTPTAKFAVYSERTPDGFIGELLTPPPQSAA